MSLADVLEAAALSLQALAGCPVTFSRSHATVEEGTYQVVVEYTEEAIKAAVRDYYDRNGIEYGRSQFPDCESCEYCSK
ncbi:hypothetical protein SDC9_205803 [bioreactor metagenome]|uniref:Cyanophycin synthase-like N-terminal domain-containing protein n=1 Tax=bioreactor metagenome TaxID=1076179 RepID=A0A645J4P2_9ZZZZ